MAREHRVRFPGQRDVARDDRAAQLLICARGTELLELVVQVEHQRRTLEAARGPAGARMQPDDEECLAAEAQREMGVVGGPR